MSNELVAKLLQLSNQSDRTRRINRAQTCHGFRMQSDQSLGLRPRRAHELWVTWGQSWASPTGDERALFLGAGDKICFSAGDRCVVQAGAGLARIEFDALPAPAQNSGFSRHYWHFASMFKHFVAIKIIASLHANQWHPARQ